MKWQDYLAARAVALCGWGILLLYLLLIVYFAGMGGQVIILTAAGFLLAVATWLTTGWYRVNTRLTKLQSRIAALPEKYLLGEILEQPADPVERQYFLAMKELSRSAIGVVEQAQKEKQEYCQYVEGWVHEIKTPLTACELILANDGDPRKLKRELRRADNLTESILYYARLRTAEKDTQITAVHVRRVVDEAVREEMELLIAADISAEVDGELVVYTDGKQLGFMLKQLLINCAKYCPGCRIAVTMADHTLTVEDNGPGIPSHELARVTERGFTGGQWRDHQDSTGMGLYLVSELCHQLNIALKIESEENRFTRFCFTFSR